MGQQIFIEITQFLMRLPWIHTKGFAAKFSRIDVRFGKFWQNNEYKYYIEAKNLKSNDSGLKRRLEGTKKYYQNNIN